MLRLYSSRRAERLLSRYDAWMREIAERWGVPAAAQKAILYQELTRMDFGDLLADLAVVLGLPWKRDSSTGPGQVFGAVGLRAVNFAVDRHLTDYASLGLELGHRLCDTNRQDVRAVWRMLHRDRRRNLEIAALNLLSAAEEMTGVTDFSALTEEQLKLTFTRYSANARRVTPYGEEAYRRYILYLTDERPGVTARSSDGSRQNRNVS